MTVLLGATPISAVLPEAQTRPAGTELQVRAAAAPKFRAQKTILAGDQPITAGGFCFRIVRVAFDTTAAGFIPEDMAPKDRLIFVEVELLSGNRDDFKALSIVLDGGAGRRSKPVALFSGGMMKALVAVTVRSAPDGYRPENPNIAWAFIVPEADADFFLIFPTGPIISLAPLIKKDYAETARTRGPVPTRTLSVVTGGVAARRKPAGGQVALRLSPSQVLDQGPPALVQLEATPQEESRQVEVGHDQGHTLAGHAAAEIVQGRPAEPR